MKPDDKLAEAYNEALALEKAGNHDAAAKAYTRVLELDPDDHGGAAVRLAAMGLGATPARACVEATNDRRRRLWFSRPAPRQEPNSAKNGQQRMPP